MKGLLTVAIYQAANKMKGATKGEKTTNDCTLCHDTWATTK